MSSVETIIDGAADRTTQEILLDTGLPSSPDSFRSAMRVAAWAAIVSLANAGHIPLRKDAAA